ncbi:MAG: hypothetical protein JW717_03640 [Marinilabiliaceae bacterium]|nr:hypothetical protein [Marinilabiliaceae bacterium]
MNILLNGQIIADHSVVELYDNIPESFIHKVKEMWLVVPGESHSAAYRYGLIKLSEIDSKFTVSVTESGVPEAFRETALRVSRATWGDLDNESGWIYSYGEEDWCCYTDYPSYTYNPVAVERTKKSIQYCNSNGIIISAIGFAHCYDDGKNIANSYIKATTEYISFCEKNGYVTKVFFTTGPIDSYMALGASGLEQFQKWEIIRDSVRNSTKYILFDYSDILSYNDSGDLSTSIHDGIIFPVIHPDNLKGSYTGHIGSVGALRLAKAMWWILARISGWDGSVTAIDSDRKNDINVIHLGEGAFCVQKEDNIVFNKLSVFNMEGQLILEKNDHDDVSLFEIPSNITGAFIVSLSNEREIWAEKIIKF